MAIQLTDDVYWLNPCYDAGDRHVHNASYLVYNDESGNFLVDTGAFSGAEAITDDIAEITDGEGISSIILTHPDLPHAANLWDLYDESIEIVTTIAATDSQGLFPWGQGLRKMITGNDMSVENRTVHAVPAPLMDRPNTIWIYDRQSGVFFTVDGFGHHHSSGECDLTSDQLPDGISVEDIRDYNQNNLPWLRFVEPEKLAVGLKQLLDRFDPTWLAPAHGNPVHSTDIQEYLDRFTEGVEEIYNGYEGPGAPNPSLQAD
jgi:flavorubredoxin